MVNQIKSSARRNNIFRRIEANSGWTGTCEIDDKRTCCIEIANCAPYDMYLPRGSIIGMVGEENKDHLQKLDGKIVDDFISQISSSTTKPPPGFNKPGLTRDEIEKKG